MSATQTATELEALEVRLLLEALYRQYGFDFRGYAYASIRRRLLARVQAEKAESLSGLQEKVLHDPECFARLVLSLTVHSTSMFRDPSFFAAVRTRRVPLLRTYPFVRVWHAGCSTGEEVYSMAILLEEEGLYDRCRIYATDLSEAALETAMAGIFPLTAMKVYTQNHLEAGGKVEFSNYYRANHGSAIFRSSLRRNLVFAPHNLVTDGSLNEFNFIVIRNVMIYFDRDLQARVHQLLYDSLPRGGVLALGEKESLRLTPHETCFEELDAAAKLYRKVR